MGRRPVDGEGSVKRAPSLCFETMTRAVDGELLARGGVSGVCPHLHVASGQWRHSVPSREHVCGAEVPMMPVGLEAQRRLCHGVPEECERFRAAAERRASAVPILPSRLVARTAPIVVQLGRSAVPVPQVIQRKVLGQATLALVMVLAVVAIVLARGFGPGQSGGTALQTLAVANPSPAVSASAAPSAGSSAVASPAATSSAAPSASGSASPTPSAATSPAASATTAPSTLVATGTYRVVANDTLVSIAAHFRTTVKTLQALNQITNPSLIRVGQVLRIP